MSEQEAVITLKSNYPDACFEQLREAVDMAIAALEKQIPDFAIKYLKEGLDKAKEQYLADGCRGCAFSDVEEWQEPCRMCKRNCKDYWRAKE